MDDHVLASPAKPDGVYRCPTCRAPWRGVTTCARCGADLRTVMTVAARAWELREAAWHALCQTNGAKEAVALARTAYRLHATPRGQRVLILALLAAGHQTEAAALIERMQA
jgi:predicted amidophosphoribosyltransferase